MKEIKLNDKFVIGDNAPLFIVAGPCQIESEDHCLYMAKEIKKIADKYPVNLIFKASYDKANRTSLQGSRGVGIELGLKILQKIKNEFGIPVITDIHSEDQIPSVSEVVDILQIPAFLCRQTDLLIAAGKSKKIINIKKGQFLHPEDLKFAIEKIKFGGSDDIILCERGSCFGYRDLVVDFRNFKIMKDLGYPVLFDATHSVQKMGGANGKSCGSREFVGLLAKSSIIAGVNGLFLETHSDPDNALSDGPNMLNLDMFDILLSEVCKIKEIL